MSLAPYTVHIYSIGLGDESSSTTERPWDGA
jgi:hypothetical protein